MPNDFLFGMMASSMLDTPRPSYSDSGARPVNYGSEIDSLRREIAMLRRDLDVAFLILVKHGLAEMPAPPEPQGEAE